MSYKNESIKTVIKQINNKYFLPHIQRKMVWDEQKIYKLYDSLLRKYPISTFLFWQIQDIDKKKEIQKLEFIKEYTKNQSNNFNYDITRDEYFLVLDGQQRLQSLYITLEGTYNGKELYFNVLSNPDFGEDIDDDTILYETKFIKTKDHEIYQSEEGKLWVKVKDFALLNDDEIFKFYKAIYEKYKSKLSGFNLELSEKNIKKLNQIFLDEQIISYFLEIEENYNKVLDIFIRTNSGGTKLSKSDLLFSIIKLKWDIDAYSEFNNLKDIINKDFEFEDDFILKTSLVLIDADIKYRVENFSSDNILLIEKNWEKIKKSIITTVELIKSLGITNNKMLASKNAIIPIINYTYLNNIKTYNSQDSQISVSKKLIKKWLFSILLTNIFTSQTDELLNRFRKVIKNNKNNLFPLTELNQSLPQGKSLIYEKKEFDKIDYNSNRLMLVLGLLYPKFELNSINESSRPHKDHIFSKAILQKKGISEKDIDTIGNIELLSSFENESKNKSSFEEWIKTRDEQFILHNYLPKDQSLYKLENYTEFVKQRKEIMYNKLNSLLTEKASE